MKQGITKEKGKNRGNRKEERKQERKEGRRERTGKGFVFAFCFLCYHNLKRKNTF